MKKLLRTFLIILFTLASNVVWSNSTTNLGGYLGCGQFLNACDISKLDIDCQAQSKWVQGYISSITYRQDIYIAKSLIDQDSIKYALINYCRQNPFKDTHDGAENLFLQIK
jgi:hypothetical protein